MADDDVPILGGIRDKLIEKKQEWARDGRLVTGTTADPARDRLPPGQRLVRDWPVLDLGVQPAIDLARWRLTVDGLVEHSLAWDWAEFLALPQRSDVSDMHCVTTWSRFGNRWVGVAMQHVLDLVQPKPEAGFALLHSYDGYTTNVPLPALMGDDVLLAHQWEGRPIPREHGGPVRMLIPKLYLWKSAKWLHRIELVGTDRPGFWEVRGYHDNGDPWTEQRYR